MNRYKNQTIQILFLFLIIGIGIPLPSAAQQNQENEEEPPENEQESLEFDEVQVVAPYEPSISDAYKIDINPEINDTVSVDIEFDYAITPTQIPVMFEMEPLNPARMKGEPLEKLYRGHIKAGMGSHVTPYLEAFYNSMRSKYHSYGIHLKHLSSNGGIEEYAHSGFSENRMNLSGKRFLKNHTLAANIDFTSNRVHYYGYKPADLQMDTLLAPMIDTLNKEDIRQTYNRFAPEISFKSNFLDDEKLQHNIRLNYYYLGDRYNAAEQNIRLRTTLDKSLGEDPMGFAETQKFHLNMDWNYFYNQSPLDTANTGLIKIEPRLSSTYKDFDFYVGLNAALQADTVSYLRFYPIAGAQVSLIDNVLYAYADLTGNLEKHNLNQISNQNPFINTQLALPFMNVKYKLRGGFRGAISSYSNYNIGISNESVSQYPFFINDFDDPLQNKFTILYDDVRIFNFRAEIFSNVGERLKVRLGGNYYEYTTDSLDRAYHAPTLTLDLGVKYNIQDKIILSASAFARNGIWAPTSVNEDGSFEDEEILRFHVDGNIGVEYRYTKLLSIFLNLNNIQNQPLERWYNYPSQRFTVLGGVSYSF